MIIIFYNSFYNLNLKSSNFQSCACLEKAFHFSFHFVVLLSLFVPIDELGLVVFQWEASVLTPSRLYEFRFYRKRLLVKLLVIYFTTTVNFIILFLAEIVSITKYYHRAK